MSSAVAFTGLACGMLLAAAGMAVWSFARHISSFSKIVSTIRLVAGAGLLWGALSAWHSGYWSPFSIRLLLMAALVSLPYPSRLSPYPPGYVFSLLLPASLAGLGLYLTLRSGLVVPARQYIPFREVVAAVGGGIGAWALNGLIAHLPELKSEESPGQEAPLSAAYAMLTISLGSLSIVNLLQHGKIWAGGEAEKRLAGAWMIWTAGRLVSSRRSWLHWILIAIACIVFVFAALS
jgi:hypothetical protein